MQDIKVRVDDELAEQLRQLAEEEEVSVSAVVRKAVRGHVRTHDRTSGRTSSPHEGTGHVR